MKITSDQSLAINAATAALNAALASFAAIYDPTEKENFARATLFDLGRSHRALGLDLARELLDETENGISGIRAALIPYVENEVEAQHVLSYLFVPRQLRAWIRELEQWGASPNNAPGTARTLVAIFGKVRTAAKVSAKAA